MIFRSVDLPVPLRPTIPIRLSGLDRQRAPVEDDVVAIVMADIDGGQ